MDSHLSPAGHSGDTLTDFLRKLWLSRLAVVLGACGGLAAGAVLLATLMPHYEAHMIVGPAQSEDRTESLTSFEAGRAVDLGAYGQGVQLSPEFVRFEQVLREATVAKILSRYDGVLDEVGTDRLFKYQTAKKVEGQALADYLRRHIRIEPVGATSSRRITYTHPDPEFAVKVLKHLHTIADETIRQKTDLETRERIGWLQKELGQSHNPDHRTALTGLLMNQERRRMLVAMDQPYAAALIEPAAAEARPAWPSKIIVLVVAVLIGAGTGFTVSRLRRSLP